MEMEVLPGRLEQPHAEKTALPAQREDDEATRKTLAANLAQALIDSRASYDLSNAAKAEPDQKKKKKEGKSKNKHAAFNIQLDRYEGKYVIPRSLVPEIREYIKPYCEPDPHGIGNPPEYTITTLQLDSPTLALHHAKEDEALNRFKLRVRTYGDPVGNAPVFLEVKSKLKSTIVKARSMVPFDQGGGHLFSNNVIKVQFKTRKEADGFYKFAYLLKAIGAGPATLIRYIRESYFGKMEQYARISFDRKLQYQFTNSWDSWGRGCKWFSIDTPLIQNKGGAFSGVVLEIKCLSDVPNWMITLVQEFDLVRIGHCKYSNAVWTESVFRTVPDTPETFPYETEFQRYLG